MVMGAKAREMGGVVCTPIFKIFRKNLKIYWNYMLLFRLEWQPWWLLFLILSSAIRDGYIATQILKANTERRNRIQIWSSHYSIMDNHSTTMDQSHVFHFPVRNWPKCAPIAVAHHCKNVVIVFVWRQLCYSETWPFQPKSRDSNR